MSTFFRRGYQILKPALTSTCLPQRQFLSNLILYILELERESTKAMAISKATVSKEQSIFAQPMEQHQREIVIISKAVKLAPSRFRESCQIFA